MDSTSRLYERLDRIPQDPEDSESLEDLIVCAFGAFERYYVCWKTRGGEYRQDGHDLPPTLQEWLYPSDGSTRDYPSLQVVFGRGDEYFASDKNGKLENKEPEIKKPLPSEVILEKQNKPVLRRARTISFLRPLSDSSTRSTDSAADTPIREPRSRRSSNTSQPPSRPPSMSFSRQTPDPVARSTSPSADTDTSQVSSRRSSYISDSTSATTNSRPTSDSAPKSFSPIPEPTTTTTTTKDSPLESPLPIQSRLVRRSRPLSISFHPSTFPKIVEGKTFSPAPTREPNSTSTITITNTSTTPNTARTHIPCTCGCLDKSNKSTPTSTPTTTYTDASVQTDPESPQRTALRIDTASTADFSSGSLPPSYNSYSSTRSSAALDLQTPLTDDDDEKVLPPPAPPAAPNPVYMGRMLDYFSRPGYQLGDSLMSSYYYYEQQQEQPVVYYEEEVERQQEVVYHQEQEREWKDGGFGDARIV